jgi:hypothetical protein
MQCTQRPEHEWRADGRLTTKLFVQAFFVPKMWCILKRGTGSLSHVTSGDTLQADDAPLREAASCNADCVAHADGYSTSRFGRPVRASLTRARRRAMVPPRSARHDASDGVRQYERGAC